MGLSRNECLERASAAYLAKRHSLDFIRQRLMDRSIPEPNSGCWLWQGALNNGYGQSSWNGSALQSHKVSWRAFRGEIPKGMFVCHRCDTRACINPDHLFLGTHADNMRDMVAKGRQLFGRRHREAKLTESAVLEIRAGGATDSAFAKKFGVAPTTVQQVRIRRSWKQV